MNYDVIVLGTGGVGSAAMYHLARAGLSVLGLDRFPPAHDRGSSHGETRVIRRSYFEHPNYVPLLNRSYELWRDLGQKSGKDLIVETGLVYFGDPNGAVLPGVLESSSLHNLGVEEVPTDEATSRFPQFVAPANSICLFETGGGYLLVEECVAAHIDQAVRRGATHRHGETVRSWSVQGNVCMVTTDKGRYESDRLVIAGGAWSDQLLRDLDLPLRVVRKHLHWYGAGSERYQSDHGCPCYFFETDAGYYYGCPAVSSMGLKVAEHSGGEEIHDPLNADRGEDPAESVRIRNFLRRHLRKLSLTQAAHKTCFYTVTPDEHFIVDHHPEHPHVTFAAGLSGHGFKFAAVLGEVLTQLTTDHTPDHNLDFLSLNRATLL